MKCRNTVVSSKTNSDSSKASTCSQSAPVTQAVASGKTASRWQSGKQLVLANGCASTELINTQGIEKNSWDIYSSTGKTYSWTCKNMSSKFIIRIQFNLCKVYTLLWKLAKHMEFHVIVTRKHVGQMNKIAYWKKK
jgi:hypothetical protein